MLVDVEALVTSNTLLSPDYNVIALEAPEIANIANPGQFVMVKPTHATDPFLRRPFSVFEILRDPYGSPRGVSLLNKQVGRVTRLIFDLKPGHRMRCLGPLGRPFTPLSVSTGAWMVAGGVGLAPFATLTEALRAKNVSITLFYGASHASELFYLERFKRLGVNLFLSTEDGSCGTHGLITVPLEHALRQAEPESPGMIYACGPTKMLHAVAKLATSYHRPLEVSLEQVMGCGLGGCYSCVVKIRGNHNTGNFMRSCLDGPVFRAEQIMWNELIA